MVVVLVFVSRNQFITSFGNGLVCGWSAGRETKPRRLTSGRHGLSQKLELTNEGKVYFARVGVGSGVAGTCVRLQPLVLIKSITIAMLHIFGNRFFLIRN